ncbi:MAG: adenylyltransferase/cytidyltransferase family protein [Patescibacteria group bacterium]
MNLEQILQHPLKLDRIKKDPVIGKMDFSKFEAMPVEVQRKIILDSNDLGTFVREKRQFGARIACTMGTMDMTHIGHMRYMAKAKREGDLLILGIDTDESVKRYKHASRPYTNQYERAEMCAHTSAVDIVTFVDDVNEKGIWAYKLIKEILPDVFTAIKESYPKRQLKEIGFYCTRINLIPRQAPGSTTDICEEIATTILGYPDLVKKIEAGNPKFSANILKAAKEITRIREEKGESQQ